MRRCSFYGLLICFNLCNFTMGGPYIWEDTKPTLRLYMPDEELRRNSKVVDLAKGVELFCDLNYDPDKPTLLIVHGWFQGAEDKIIIMLLDSLFQVKFYEKMNIMVLDTPWFLDSKISNLSYFALANNIEMLGNIVADIFNEAIQKKQIKPQSINLLGLSLGAHLSGYISRAVLGQVHSIVGLDPAGPGFSKLQIFTSLKHVSKTDAQFVHLYHTNPLVFGTSQRLGTADFEFNEDLSQPGCVISIDPKCSHKRAFYVFNDLILGDKKLVALRCDTLEDFQQCHCRENPTVTLQYPVDTSAEGLHFLRTNSEAPFGLGPEGVTCWQDQWDALQREKEAEQSWMANALTDITEKFKSNMEVLQKKEIYLALFRFNRGSEEETPKTTDGKTEISPPKTTDGKTEISPPKTTDGKTEISPIDLIE